jgi:hypothetical protein
MRFGVPGSTLGLLFGLAVAGGAGGCSSSGTVMDGSADRAPPSNDGQQDFAKDNVADSGPAAPDGQEDLSTGGVAETIGDVPRESPSDALDDVSARPTTDGPTFMGWHSLVSLPLPTPWPRPRASPAIAFDETRRKIVLFGGHGGGSASYSYETWEFDVASGTWANRTVTPRPSSWPSGRESMGLAFDSSVGRVVLFGGGSDSGETQDLWEWDGAAGTWLDRTPAPLSAPWPSRRAFHAVAYDTKRARLVLFGGSGQGGENLQDLWEWDGKAGVWSNRTPSPLPASWPARRYVHQMAYDATRGVVTLFGGYVNLKAQNDTWEWNGSAGTWTERKAPAGAPVPLSRMEHGMAYDASRGRVVLFGGRDIPLVVFHDTWEWDGANGQWTNLTPAALPATWPSGRMFLSGGMTFVSSLGRVVFFGGIEEDGGARSDLWEWWGF